MDVLHLCLQTLVLLPQELLVLLHQPGQLVPVAFLTLIQEAARVHGSLQDMVLQHGGKCKKHKGRKKVVFFVCVSFLGTPWLRLLNSSTYFVGDVLQLFFQQRHIVLEGVPLLLQVLQVRLETRTLAIDSLQGFIQRPDLQHGEQQKSTTLQTLHQTLHTLALSRLVH